MLRFSPCLLYPLEKKGVTSSPSRLFKLSKPLCVRRPDHFIHIFIVFFPRCQKIYDSNNKQSTAENANDSNEVSYCRNKSLLIHASDTQLF